MATIPFALEIVGVLGPETLVQLNALAKRLFSPVKTALDPVLTMRSGPGSAIGRPGMSGAPPDVAVPAPSCESMKVASICGAVEFQKSVCGIRDSGMLPRSNTGTLIRSA